MVEIKAARIIRFFIFYRTNMAWNSSRKMHTAANNIWYDYVKEKITSCQWNVIKLKPNQIHRDTETESEGK